VTAETQEDWERARRELATFLFRLIAAKRAEPADDLLSMFVAVFDREDDLPDLQLVVLTTQLLIDGHQTTRNQMRILLYALLRRPDLYTGVCADPGGDPRCGRGTAAPAPSRRADPARRDRGRANRRSARAGGWAGVDRPARGEPGSGGVRRGGGTGLRPLRRVPKRSDASVGRIDSGREEPA
jgi:hypothetical protein